MLHLIVNDISVILDVALDGILCGIFEMKFDMVIPMDFIRVYIVLVDHPTQLIVNIQLQVENT